MDLWNRTKDICSSENMDNIKAELISHDHITSSELMLNVRKKVFEQLAQLSRSTVVDTRVYAGYFTENSTKIFSYDFSRGRMVFTINGLANFDDCQAYFGRLRFSCDSNMSDELRQAGFSYGRRFNEIEVDSVKMNLRPGLEWELSGGDDYVAIVNLRTKGKDEIEMAGKYLELTPNNLSCLDILFL